MHNQLVELFISLINDIYLNLNVHIGEAENLNRVGMI